MLTRKLIGIEVLASTVALSLCAVSTPASAAEPYPYCANVNRESDFRGLSLNLEVNAEVPNLDTIFDTYYNDAISSLIVYRGCVCTFYWDANYLGKSLTYDARDSDVRIPWIGDEWNDQISSAKCKKQ